MASFGCGEEQRAPPERCELGEERECRLKEEGKRLEVLMRGEMKVTIIASAFARAKLEH